MVMDKGIPALLRELHMSYLKGSNITAPESAGDEQAVAKLLQETEEFLRSQLDPQEWRITAQAGDARERGLRAVRNQQVEVARQWFSTARAIAESPLLSDAARMCNRSWLAAAEAYLDYRSNNPNSARQRLYESLAADEFLETKYRHRLFHIHRLHLIRNLIRVETLSGNIEAALDLATRVACYLQGRSDETNPPGSWNRDFLPYEAIPFMFTGIIVEVCQTLGGRDAEALRPLFVLLEDRFPKRDSLLWQSHALDWFLTKRAFAKEDVHSFLERAVLYLSNGPGSSVLWRYASLDVVLACEGLPFQEANELQRTILRHAPEWKHMPTQLRSLVQDLAAAFACRSMNVGSALA